MKNLITILSDTGISPWVFVTVSRGIHALRMSIVGVPAFSGAGGARRMGLACLLFLLGTINAVVAAGENAVDNGDFELVDPKTGELKGWRLTYWRPLPAKAELSRIRGGQNGNHAALVRHLSGGHNMFLSQRISLRNHGLKVGDSVSVGVSVSGNSLDLPRIAIIAWAGKGEKLGMEQSRPVRLQATWQRMEMSYTIPQKATHLSLLLRCGRGVTRFDAVRLTRTAARSTVAATEKKMRPVTVCLKAGTPPDLDADPGTWGAVPAPMGDIRVPDIWKGPADLGATAYTMWDDQAFYLGVKVVDDDFQEGSHRQWYMGDVIQFAFDPFKIRSVGKFSPSDHEWGLALQAGVPRTIRWKAATGLPTGDLDTVDLRVRLVPGGIVYTMRAPWGEMAPVSPKIGASIGFSIAAMDVDGKTAMTQDTNEKKMNQAMWAGGVMGGKDPSLYGDLYFAASGDSGTVLKYGTDNAVLVLDKTTVASKDELKVKVRVPAVLAKIVGKAQLTLGSQVGNTLASAEMKRKIEADGSACYALDWIMPELNDGSYKLTVGIVAGDGEIRVARQLRVATKQISRINQTIANVETGIAKAVRQPQECSYRSRLCLAQAREALRFDRLEVALDCARQARVWAERVELPLVLPLVDVSGVVGEPVTGNVRIRRGISVEQGNDAWELFGKGVRICLDRKTLAITVAPEKGAAPGATWISDQSKPVTARFRLADRSCVDVGLATAGSMEARHFDGKDGVGVEILFSKFAQAPSARVRLRLVLDPESGECTTVILPDPVRDDATNLVDVNWPGAFPRETGRRGYYCLPSRGGCIIPDSWQAPLKLHYPLGGYRFGHPYWAIKGDDNCLMVLVDTAYDAETDILHVPGGATSITLDWATCWGLMRYPRKARLILFDGGDHVTAAKRYRKWLMDNGHFKTLAKKAGERPVVGDYAGSMKLTVEMRHRRMSDVKVLRTFDEIAAGLEAVKAMGVDKLYIQLRRWNSLTKDPEFPSIYPPGVLVGGWEGLHKVTAKCNELGWIAGLYDMYLPFYLTSPDYDEAKALKGSEGVAQHLHKYNGVFSWMAPAHHFEFVKRNTDILRQKAPGVRLLYLDTFGGWLVEDFDARHPTTRYQTALHRQRCMDYVTNAGLFCQAEGEAFWSVDNLDAPFWSPETHGVETLSAPLNALAVHDALYINSHIRRFRPRGGRGKLDSRDNTLRCILLGEAPMICNVWPLAKRYVRLVPLATKVHKAVAMREMLSHTFLSDDFMVQETEFAGGVRITADYRDHTVVIRGIDGIPAEKIKVPTFGFDLEVKVREFKVTGPREFDLTLEWQSHENTETALDNWLEIVGPDARKPGASYRQTYLLNDANWKAGQTIVDGPHHFVVDDRFEGGRLSLRCSPFFAGTSQIAFAEGIKAGAGKLPLGTLEVEGAGKDTKITFKPEK